jgi:hypothetical protein
MAHNNQEWTREEGSELFKGVKRMYLINLGIKDPRNIMLRQKKGLRALAEKSSPCATYANNLVILQKIASMVLIEITH